MIVLDTSGLLAALDAAQTSHEEARSTLEQAVGPLLLSPFVLAELDYLLARRVGEAAQRALLDEVADEAFRLEPFGADDVARARDVLRRFPDLHLGLADASLMVLAERHGTHDLLTLDHRHFRAVTLADGSSLRLLPADA